MHSTCIICRKKHSTETKQKDFICKDCLKNIIKNNQSLVEEYEEILHKKSCLNCEYRKNISDEDHCRRCSYYSEWVLDW